MSADRLARMRAVLESRTRALTVVLENVYQPHNASAVLRSCECFGVQDLHVVEAEATYCVNPGIARGAAKWVDLYRHVGPVQGEGRGRATAACLEGLKAAGYRVVATVPPSAGAIPVGELPLDRPLALCFGAEERGLSPEAIGLADGAATVPMFGFTGSLNLSVAAALCLYELTGRLRAGPPESWQLPPGERGDLWLRWLKSSVRAADLILERECQVKGPGEGEGSAR